MVNKRIEIWLSRDNGDGMDTYGIDASTKKPRISKEDIYWGTETNFCPNLWHRLTGIRLRKGQCKQVKITHLKKGFKFELI